VYDEYDRITARYYDAAYAALPSLGDDVDFYRSLARETGGPVLEIGCGTGRVLERVAADGFACTGLDASPAMLDRLRERVGDRVRLVQSDMRDFDLGEDRFPLIFSAFRPFQHLVSVEDQLRCLACVRAHLAPAGRFAFDVFNPRLERMADDEEPEIEDLRFSQDGEQVVRYARVERDRPQQSFRVFFRYERHAGGRVAGNDHTEFRMRWFFRYELEHLMIRGGFSDVEIYGDFDRSPVERHSPAFIVVARR
jgi:SAM-dependent methyltransferase